MIILALDWTGATLAIVYKKWVGLYVSLFLDFVAYIFILYIGLAYIKTFLYMNNMYNAYLKKVPDVEEPLR